MRAGRSGRAVGSALARRAGRRRRRRGAARGIRGGAVPVRHRGGLEHRAAGAGRRRRGRPGAGQRGVLAAVSRPGRHPAAAFVQVTNGLIALLAAGMAGQAAAVLHGADLLPGWGEQLWDTSLFLPTTPSLGRSLHALVGYSARPSGIQFAAWLATLVMLVVAVPRDRAGRRAPAGRGRRASGRACGRRPVGPCRRFAALVFRQHRFVPDHIKVPAHQNSKLHGEQHRRHRRRVRKRRAQPRETGAPGPDHHRVSRSADPGDYKFFGDFHQDTAQGVMVAK